MIKQGMMAAALLLGTTSIAAPATAQLTQQGGLVNVTVGDVTLLNNFLNRTQLAALNNLNVPITVQAPISVAANVCGTTVAVLAKSATRGACEATSGSAALARLVNRQVLMQKKR